MTSLPPLALTIGIFLIGIGLIAGITAELSGGGHFSHLLALAGIHGRPRRGRTFASVQLLRGEVLPCQSVTSSTSFPCGDSC